MDARAHKAGLSPLLLLLLSPLLSDKDFLASQCIVSTRLVAASLETLSSEQPRCNGFSSCFFATELPPLVSNESPNLKKKDASFEKSGISSWDLEIERLSSPRNSELEIWVSREEFEDGDGEEEKELWNWMLAQMYVWWMRSQPSKPNLTHIHTSFTWPSSSLRLAAVEGEFKFSLVSKRAKRREELEKSSVANWEMNLEAPLMKIRLSWAAHFRRQKLSTLPNLQVDSHF